MDETAVCVGDTWWLHLDDASKCHDFEQGDYRHHFRPGMISEIMVTGSQKDGNLSNPTNGFWVQPGISGAGSGDVHRVTIVLV